MIVRNNLTEVAYNVQTVVDAKNHLLIDYKVTNENDSRALSGMLRRTKTILGTTDFTALFDKGYHNAIEIKKATDLDIEIMIAEPASSSNAPDEKYNMSHFTYDELNDTYTCPQNHILKTNGNWYKKNTGNTHYFVNHYKTNACSQCHVRNSCTKNPKGRVIERSEYAPYIEINRKNIEANPQIYKKRQSIIEHSYGTIKRQWGFNYILTKKGKKRASADVGFMFIAYNLRRLINILGKSKFQKFLKELDLLFSTILTSIKATIFKIRPSIFSAALTKPFFNAA